MTHTSKLWSMFIVAVLLLAVTAPAISQDQKETFVGMIIAAGGFDSGSTERLTIDVEKWTTAEEVQHLIQVLATGGMEALIKEMRGMTAGYIRGRGSLRWPLDVAISVQTEQGRLITLITERPMSFVEAAYDPALSRENAFGYMEFLLGEDGKGQGVVIEAARIRFQNNNIQVESLWNSPHILNSIRKTK
ncbi:MAG: hypothetical protein ACERK6_10535 [Candidatus Aminicenantaceae bacterium]